MTIGIRRFAKLGQRSHFASLCSRRVWIVARRYRSFARSRGEWCRPDLGAIRWPFVVFGAIAIGLMSGITSFVFLRGLEWVTDRRIAHDQLVWFLPLIGLCIGVIYRRAGPKSAKAHNAIFETIEQPGQGVPLAIAPLSLLSTWATHLVGGSGGREGTAMQIASSLTDAGARRFRATAAERQVLLCAAFGGAFGAVFGVPLAGTMFGVEVPRIRRVMWRALLPTAIASNIGSRVVVMLGYEDTQRDHVRAPIGHTPIGALFIAALMFGLVAMLYVLAVSIVKGLAKLAIWPPLGTAVGGLLLVVLWQVFGNEYLGLSLSLGASALNNPAKVVATAFLVKLLFTAVTSGSGFRAGEVTPLFVIGAALGAALATPLGVDPKLLAALGFVTVYATAARAPVACAVMGMELFGMQAWWAFLFVTLAASLVGGRRSIYPRSPRFPAPPS